LETLLIDQKSHERHRLCQTGHFGPSMQPSGHKPVDYIEGTDQNWQGLGFWNIRPDFIGFLMKIS